MSVPSERGPGPLPAVIGGVIAAVVLFWLAGIVVGTVVFVVRLLVIVGLVLGGLWVWGKLTPDD
jgi:hypothetical protein